MHDQLFKRDPNALGFKQRKLSQQPRIRIAGPLTNVPINSFVTPSNVMSKRPLKVRQPDANAPRIQQAYQAAPPKRLNNYLTDHFSPERVPVRPGASKSNQRPPPAVPHLMGPKNVVTKFAFATRVGYIPNNPYKTN